MGMTKGQKAEYLEKIRLESKQTPYGMEVLLTPAPIKIKPATDIITALSPCVYSQKEQVPFGGVADKHFLSYVYGDEKNKAYVATNRRILCVYPVDDAIHGFFVTTETGDKVNPVGYNDKTEKVNYVLWQNVVPKDNQLHFFPIKDLNGLIAKLNGAIKINKNFPSPDRQGIAICLTLAGVRFYFNPEYLFRALKSLILFENNDIAIGVSAPDKPMKLITESPTYAVIMPIRWSGTDKLYSDIFAV